MITRTVRSVSGQPLDGMVLVQRGELHGNAWEGGGFVRDGGFRLEVSRGGQYGLHLYASGYFYRPAAVVVRSGSTRHVDRRMTPEPTREPDPLIRRAEFEPRGTVTVVRMDVASPYGHLGPQQLAFDARRGRSHALAPPRPVRDLEAAFPNGVYTLEVEGPVDPRDGYFVAADHACFTSDILAFPHEPRPGQRVR